MILYKKRVKKHRKSDNIILVIDSKNTSNKRLEQ